MADESCFSPHDALTIARLGGVGILGLKLTKSGRHPRPDGDRAHRRGGGPRLYVGCMIETSLGTAAYLQVALAATPVTWGCELFGPLLLAGDVTRDPVRYADGAILGAGRARARHRRGRDLAQGVEETDMRQRSWIVSVLVLVACVAVGAVAPAPAFAQGPVKIGVLTPLSPPGDASRRAVHRPRREDGRGRHQRARRRARRAQGRDGHRGRFGHAGKGRRRHAQAGHAGPAWSRGRSVPQLRHRRGAGSRRAVQDPRVRHAGIGQEPDRAASQLHLPDARDRSRSRHALEPLDQAAGLQARGPHRREHRLRRRADRGHEEAVPDDGRRGRAQDRDLRPPGRRSHAAAARDQELEAGPAHQRAASARPSYLIIKQAYDIGLFPATPMLVSYDLPARPEFWKNLGEKGNYLTFIVVLPPDDEADRARRGVPDEVPRAVQGGAGLRRASTRYAQVDADRRRDRPRPRATRPTTS